MSQVTWDNTVFLQASHGWKAQAVHEFASQVRDEAEALAPVLDIFRTRPPGEAESKPPGRLRESLAVRDTTDLGEPEAHVTALYVARFIRKHEHAIRDFFTPAVASVAARWGP